MIRHRCAACGCSINRTDSFFEPSDGTLCHDCLARLAPGAQHRPAASAGFASPPPAWTILPELVPHRQS